MTVLDIYKNKIKNEWKLAYKAAFIIGIITHLYKFANMLPNHDALYNVYSNQNMIGSGRWLLTPACMFSSYFDLPWITGLLAIFFLAFSASALVEIFELTNPVTIVLVSGLLASFPAITETFFYEYTSDGYMIAMFIASYAVISSRVDCAGLKSWLVPILCVCCACGIYQAYVSYGAVLMLCYLIFVILKGDHKAEVLYKWLGKQTVIYGGGLALYFVVWKILLKVEGVKALGYEGIDNVGRINAGVITSALFKMIKELIQFFIKWDVRKYGFNMWIVMGILFLAAFAAGIIMSVYKSGVYKKKGMLILLILALAAIPFAAFMWFFTSDGVIYNVRMEQSLCLLYVLVVVLYDRFAYVKLADCAAALIAVCVVMNILIANIYYHYMELAYKKGYATAVELSTRIHAIDNGNAKDIAIIGQLPGFEYEDYKNASLLGDLGPLYVVDHNLADNSILLPLFMSNYLDFTLAYYANNDEEVPVYVPIDETAPTSGGWEVRFPYVTAEEQIMLEKSDEVKDMDVWPSKDSVKVIDDTVVVKFAEPAGTVLP